MSSKTPIADSLDLALASNFPIEGKTFEHIERPVFLPSGARMRDCFLSFTPSALAEALRHKNSSRVGALIAENGTEARFENCCVVAPPIALCDLCAKPFFLPPSAPHKRFCSAVHRDRFHSEERNKALLHIRQQAKPQ